MSWDEFKVSTDKMPDNVHYYTGLGGKNLVSISWRPDASNHSILIITEETLLAIYRAYERSKKEGRIVSIAELQQQEVR